MSFGVLMYLPSEHIEECKSADQNVADVPIDLISRQDAIDAIQNAYCKPCKERGDDHNEVRCRVCEYDNAIIQIDALPSTDRHEYNLESIADIVKQLGHLDGCIADMCDRQNGEWLYLENEPYSRCSVCGAYIDDLDDDKYKFCPYCGAIMKGGQDE